MRDAFRDLVYCTVLNLLCSVVQLLSTELYRLPCTEYRTASRTVKAVQLSIDSCMSPGSGVQSQQGESGIAEASRESKKTRTSLVKSRATCEFIL